MTLEEYKKEASRTYPSLGSVELDLLHMDLGITTEFGEICDIIKKKIAYGKDIDMPHMSEEIADAMWYVVNRARIENEDIDEESIYNTSNMTLDEFADRILDWDILSVSATQQVIYLRTIAEFFKINFEKSLENNINKLRIRFPDKFSQEKALNRNLDAERKELEK